MWMSREDLADLGHNVMSKLDRLEEAEAKSRGEIPLTREDIKLLEEIGIHRDDLNP